MPTVVIMPALGMAQETGKILRWHKAEGDAVEKGEPLFEVETDKVTVDVDAPADGTLAGIRVAEGGEVPVGEPVAVVLASGEVLPEESEPRLVREVEAVAAAAPAASNSLLLGGDRRGRRLASPKARRLAAARGIDIETLSGSGPNGAVVAADVEAWQPAADPVASNRLLLGEGGGASTILELPSVWRVMAERTTQAWQSVPHFFLRREVDATRLQSWRAAARAKAGGDGITHTDLLVRVAAEALVRHARVNSSWRDGTIAANERVNIGIAVAADDGLVVPVVHDADRLELPEIAARRAELVAAARARRLRPEDVAGGTFTISNLGMFGVDSFDAIVNAPQAAILAVGRIRDRIVALDGQAAVRPVLELGLSLDHRVVDGARGAEFLDTLASLIEEPAGLVR